MQIEANDVGKPPEDVLAKPNVALAGRLRNLDDRLTIGQAPDGTPAIEMRVLEGENKINSFHSAALIDQAVTKACASVDVYFEDGFEWQKKTGTKIGLGLWGGNKRGPRYDSGGWPPELQTGWSVRVLNNRRGMRLYSYDLGRERKRIDQERCEPHGCMYGDVISPVAKLALGRWVPLDLELVLNDVGEANGTLRFWVDGKLATETKGLIFRRQPGWEVKGLKFTDMWGGNTGAPKNFSIKPQRHWYANYRIYGTS